MSDLVEVLVLDPEYEDFNPQELENALQRYLKSQKTALYTEHVSGKFDEYSQFWTIDSYKINNLEEHIDKACESGCKLSNIRSIEVMEKLNSKFSLIWIDELFDKWEEAFDLFSITILDSKEFLEIVNDYDDSEIDMVFDHWIESRTAWYKIIKQIKFKNHSRDLAWEDFHSTDLGGPEFACITCGVIYFDNYAICGDDYLGSVNYYKGNCSERCKKNMIEVCSICDIEYKPFERQKLGGKQKGLSGTCSSVCFEIFDKIRQKKNYDSNYISQVKRRIGQYSSEVLIDESVTRSEVYKMHEGICKICGIETDFYFTSTNRLIFANVDHVIPISKGGGHTWNNVQLLCQHCNCTKHDNFV